MKVDPAELVDAGEVAKILGLGNRRSISVYREKVPGFPQPVVHKSRCVLWRRQDIEKWGKARAER